MALNKNVSLFLEKGFAHESTAKDFSYEYGWDKAGRSGPEDTFMGAAL